MSTPPISEGPEVAASEPSQPIAPQKNEQETTSMTQNTDKPVGLRAFLRSLTGDSLTRFRVGVAEVKPARLTASDVGALLDLIQAAIDSNSPFGRAMREREAERSFRNQVVQ